jgi:heptosyltransferase-3
MKNMVILRMRYLGDILLLVPLLKKLLQAYPGIVLTVVANQGTEYPLTMLPGIRVIVFNNRSFWGKFRSSFLVLKLARERKWDLWVDWTVSDRSRFFSRFAKASRKLFSGWKTDERALSDNAAYFPLDFNHGPNPVIEQYASSLLTRGIDLRKPFDPIIFSSSKSKNEVELWRKRNGVEESCPILLIHPGGREWYKRWPPDRFAQVGNWWSQEHNGFVVIAGSKDDQTLIESVASGFKKGTRFSIVQEPIPFLHALMESATLFLGNDSGPFHLADASDLYGVVLFGSTTPAVWGPVSKGRIIPLYDPPSCSPCTHEGCSQGTDNCLRRIEVDMVIRSLSQQLAIREQQQREGAPS